MSMILCLYALVLLFVTSSSQSYDEENILNDHLFYTPAYTSTKPKIIKTNAKSTVNLECSDKCELQRGHSKWQFKSCSSEIKAVPCEKFYENAYQPGNRDGWIKVHAKHSKSNRCYCDLEISNVSRASSGLYRYIINNKTKRVYEIIISDVMNDDDRTSKIIINPKNITVPTNTELVIRCSVNNPSSIMWFKETDATGYDIMYDGHYYSKLSTTVYPNHVLESTEYQSKLSIRKVSLSDSGVYVCVGVNEDSIKTEVNVVTVIGYNWEPHMSFSLLFLVPLAFALVPITVWLCYYRKKRKDSDRSAYRQRMKLISKSRNLPASNV